jgi:hypothetical protein
MVSKSAFCSSSRSLQVSAASTSIFSGGGGGFGAPGRSAVPASARRAGFCLGLHARQQHRHHAAGDVGVAPVDVESLLEEFAVFDAVYQAGGQRVMEVLPALQPCHLQRLQGQLDAVGGHGHAGVAQHAPEVHDVGGQVGWRRAFGRGHPDVLERLKRQPSAARPAASSAVVAGSGTGE